MRFATFLLHNVGVAHILTCLRRDSVWGANGVGALNNQTDLEKLPKLRKKERRAQILLELRLHPHVRISDLSERFGVSTETIRRDFATLSSDGLLNRDHGGASALSQGQYPSFEERNSARVEERERIGRAAARLVHPGETVMIDSGSTTLQCARFIAFQNTPCTVLTNSLTVAMALGQSDAVDVVMAPGDYLPSEAANVGPDAIDFIKRHNVDRCLIGASGLSEVGPSEAVRGFAAIKRAMLRQSAEAHLLIDSKKFGKAGLAHIGALADLASIVADKSPKGELALALIDARVDIHVAQDY